MAKLPRSRWLLTAVACMLGCSSSDPPPPDASSDGGGVVDRGIADGGNDADQGGGCPLTFADCTQYIDLTAPGATREVVFREFEYDPKCVRIRVGQSVTFVGDAPTDTFAFHPLRQVCGPAEVLNVSDAVASTSLTFDQPGTYNYYCLDHGNAEGAVMAGAIDVVP